MNPTPALRLYRHTAPRSRNEKRSRRRTISPDGNARAPFLTLILKSNFLIIRHILGRLVFSDVARLGSIYVKRNGFAGRTAPGDARRRIERHGPNSTIAGRFVESTVSRRTKSYFERNPNIRPGICQIANLVASTE